mmetsp:Transcript_6276/g.11723  ORF Transcript_6276/g.11723 Transcript_6276/m.11723 type:complete len:227 (-) Transcript_6276:1290-1970(-)
MRFPSMSRYMFNNSGPSPKTPASRCSSTLKAPAADSPSGLKSVPYSRYSCSPANNRGTFCSRDAGMASDSQLTVSRSCSAWLTDADDELRTSFTARRRSCCSLRSPAWKLGVTPEICTCRRCVGRTSAPQISNACSCLGCGHGSVGLMGLLRVWRECAGRKGAAAVAVAGLGLGFCGRSDSSSTSTGRPLRWRHESGVASKNCISMVSRSSCASNKYSQSAAAMSK